MMATIYQALENAGEQVVSELKAIEAAEPPPAREYFVSFAHQKLFLLLCGADPESFEGGDPDLADFVIENNQNIRDHYWSKGAEAGSEHPHG